MERKTMKLMKAGGTAAVIHSAAYLVGIILYFTSLGPVIDADPGTYLDMLPEYRNVLYLWIFIAYWVAAFCLIVVIQAMHRHIKGDSEEENLLNTSSVLGFIWAGLIIASGNLMLHNFLELGPSTDVTVWVALKSAENGIISGNEFIGGLWVATACIVAIRKKRLSRLINISGLVIGAAGILSLFPPLNQGASLFFGLLMIPWFLVLGIRLFRIKE